MLYILFTSCIYCFRVWVAILSDKYYNGVVIQVSNGRYTKMKLYEQQFNKKLNHITYIMFISRIWSSFSHNRNSYYLFLDIRNKQFMYFFKFLKGKLNVKLKTHLERHN